MLIFDLYDVFMHAFSISKCAYFEIEKAVNWKFLCHSDDLTAIDSKKYVNMHRETYS